MTDKTRDEFEAAIAEEAGQPLVAIQLSRMADSYSTSALIYAWWAWQQSRKALVIEWPDQHTYTTPDVAGAAILDCMTAYSKAKGLKVTP
jgi:hypothetical protein